MPDYNNFRSMDEDTEAKLFVGGLAWDSTEESIQEYFEKFGTVLEVSLKRNKDDPSKHRGFCFVKFSSQEFADSVLTQTDPHVIDGSKVDPKSVCPPGVKPEQRTKKIFVGGLQDQTTEEALTEYFSQFGQLQSNIEFSVDRNTQRRRGFCFVEFINESIVDRIVKTKYHMIAGVRVETKRVLTKAQQAEENARQSAIHTIGTRTSPYSAVGAVPGASAYGQAGAQVALSSYGQPVIYIHPDSLSTIYPQSALGGYQLGAASTAAMPSASYSTYGNTIDTLYQPYSRAVPSPAANLGRGTGQYTLKRRSPYPLKKY